MEAHKPDLGIQILGLFNPKQGRKYRTYQFDLLITENEFKNISTKVSHVTKMARNDWYILKANVKFAVSRMPMNKDHQDVVDAFYQVLR